MESFGGWTHVSQVSWIVGEDQEDHEDDEHQDFDDQSEELGESVVDVTERVVSDNGPHEEDELGEGQDPHEGLWPGLDQGEQDSVKSDLSHYHEVHEDREGILTGLILGDLVLGQLGNWVSELEDVNLVTVQGLHADQTVPGLDSDVNDIRSDHEHDQE